MKLAIHQTAGWFLDIDRNLELLAQTAATAAQQGVDLLVLPELFLTGYNLGDRLDSLAQSAAGEALTRVAAIARDWAVAIAIGYPERDGDRVFNAVTVIDATGQQVAHYRKIHLYGPEEKRLFAAGDEWVMVAIAGVQVGLLICFDVEFPEAVRTLALQGAELIIVPTTLAGPHEAIPLQIVPTRAMENQIFVAYANRIGHEGALTYCGHSCIVDPSGTAIAQAGYDEALLIGEIDPTLIARERAASHSYLSDRRPALYRLSDIACLGSTNPTQKCGD
ncbi:MAG TPA: carbon-nitrogen hydrolase family protein [Chroococcidiopsis sp.]